MIVLNSILDEIFEKILSNCCCFHQICLNCRWCFDLWIMTNNCFTFLKWMLPTFDDTITILHNVYIIFNPYFAQIFRNIFFVARLTVPLKFAISPAMIWLDNIHLWTASFDVFNPIMNPFCFLLTICSRTCSGVNLLKLSLDLLKENWPSRNSR